MSPLRKKTLFWDTDITKLDVKKHSRTIIERILQFGDMNDYNWMRENYSKDEICSVIKRDRSQLNKKSFNFWNFIFNIAN